MSSLAKLAAAVRERRAILFAGAGVSMSVGLPSWTELIDHMRGELGLENLDGTWTYQTLAEYYRLQHGSIGPLRSWMDRTWSVSLERVKESRIHDIIVELDFPIIYTTNYDNNLEQAYQLHDKRFVKVANTSDIVNADIGLPQIVKFHGDFDDDESLVIAETDYFKRLAFETPLDTKFKADALGRTLLFVGYSMSDLNIRLTLYRMWQTWRDSGRERDRPASFVFTAKEDPVQDAVLEQWGITVLHEKADHPAESMLAFLSRLRDAVAAG
ncbi:SIR2 family NAD-dependent protein deacylase [Sphingomonas sp. IC081]|uniref:SIR2 family NAD-dependent protein deacylase n=1 Tax=Sphingomonas sp. IC081 TaxID=304378 RepID=UPI0011591F6E|nr:SIR2 family protein [Sphingomonas sp. IC081]QDK35701.1 Sir2 family NAD-dependent protein deacetylase [Sphingomonas sp. IC081]